MSYVIRCKDEFGTDYDAKWEFEVKSVTPTHVTGTYTPVKILTCSPSPYDTSIGNVNSNFLSYISFLSMKQVSGTTLDSFEQSIMD